MLATRMISAWRSPIALAATLPCLLGPALLTPNTTRAAPPSSRVEVSEPAAFEPDVVGPNTKGSSRASIAAVDTIWIAAWDFEGMTGCDSQGWESLDLRIGDGQVHWNVDPRYQGNGNILGKAAILGEQNACWPQGEGYCNDWYEGIRVEYQGATLLSFDYLLDSEAGYDYMRVEVDSACSSFGRVDYSTTPWKSSIEYRSVLFATDGLELQGHVEALPLPDFGAPSESHCVYLSFLSDAGFAPCDGMAPTQLGAAVVIDHLETTGGTGISEDFEGSLDPAISFVSMHDAQPFGEWARLVSYPGDPQPCDPNKSCAWIWSDHTTPTLATDPDLDFGPGGFAVRSWLDDAIVSPWVSLASTPGALATLVEYERFGGNPLGTSRILHQISARGKRDGTEGDCVDPWPVDSFASLNSMNWLTIRRNVSNLLDPDADWIQVRHRVTDQQFLGAPPPMPYSPGPGPYIDRTRIGRVVATGPSIEEGFICMGSSQAQDRFPSEPNPAFPPGVGDRFRSSTDRFGTADFSMSSQIARLSEELVIGDSILVKVTDQRQTGSFNGVTFYAAIIAGPHAGKAPPPWTPGPEGFFQVPATLAIDRGGIPLEADYFVDLDDDYFRGGDVLLYFWLVEDGLGAVTSLPFGLTGVPASLPAAEAATGGLYEVSFLPRINWSPAYLARIAADPYGKLEPTPEETAASTQSNRILYCQMVNPARRSGDANRTSFMYTLDRLGYRGHYDTYDHMGLQYCAYVHSQLGSRATVEQASGYGLIVHDTGRAQFQVLPDGRDAFEGKEIDQASWFQEWLSQGAASEAGYATLWLLGENVLEEQLGFNRPPTVHPLYTDFLGVDLLDASQDAGTNPDVAGVQSFTFYNPDGSSPTDFSGDVHRLLGGCPTPRSFDAMVATGTASATHRYRNPFSSALESSALVMNSDPLQGWNTIVQSHPWFDVQEPPGGPASGGGRSVRTALAAKILEGVLPASDRQSEVSTDAGLDPSGNGELPHRTTLYANAPNPFNPATTIRFDLAVDGSVDLRIYDIAGRHVRTLLREELPRGTHSVTWDGRDAKGSRAPSGLFVYRLVAPNFQESRKMILLQ